jgi:hypothetical protein
MQAILDRYRVGVGVVDVTVQQAQPPEQVQAAFEDANKAAQDRERLVNEGRAYANDVIRRARGTASRLQQEAEGYRDRVIATAEGDASRFKQVLTEYSKAPAVTRERLYLDTMQQVFANTSKVLSIRAATATCCICRSIGSSSRRAPMHAPRVRRPRRAPATTAATCRRRRPRRCRPARVTGCVVATATRAADGDVAMNKIVPSCSACWSRSASRRRPVRRRPASVRGGVRARRDQEVIAKPGCTSSSRRLSRTSSTSTTGS